MPFSRVISASNILVVLLFAIASYASASAQTTTGDRLPERLIPEVDVTESALLLALSKVAYENNVPIGVEFASGAVAPEKVELHLKNKTLREVLDAIVRQDPNYQWQVRNGVVAVTPVRNRDPLLAELLATSVQRFEVSPTDSRLKVRTALVEAPGMKEKLSAANLTPAIMAFTGIDHARIRVSLSIQNMAFQDVLDEIVRKSTSTRLWVINRFGDNREFLILNF